MPLGPEHHLQVPAGTQLLLPDGSRRLLTSPSVLHGQQVACDASTCTEELLCEHSREERSVGYRDIGVDEHGQP